MLDDAPLASLLTRLPWLLDANSWSLESGPGEPASVDDAGVWPVGNGRVFAHAGLKKPYNRLQGIVGPTYQTRGDYSVEGAFGDCWLEVRAAAGTVELPYQSIWRPRNSGVLVTRGFAESLSVIAIDFAPPGVSLLIRVVEVWGHEALGEGGMLTLRVPAARPHRACRGVLTAAYHQGQILVVGMRGKGVTDEPGRLCVPIVGLDREGGVVRTIAVLATGSDLATAIALYNQAEHWPTLLDQTGIYWQDWLARTSTPTIWPQYPLGRTSTERSIADLIELNKVNLKMQQALPGGAVSPMVHFKGTWTRDSNGPIRAFLAMEAMDEARSIIEYHYKASIALGHIPNSAPLDLDINSLDDRDDWSAVPVPHAEIPSFIILQHRWWLEAGGDPDLVHLHWEYLRRCATGQALTGGGLQTFHGDETYLRGSLYSIFPERAGWPNDLIADHVDQGCAPYSLDSMIEYVAAQEAMAWMAKCVKRPAESELYARESQTVRATIEERFWMEERGYYAPAIYPLNGAKHEAPFAPINLRALWLGYHSGHSERARRNLAAVVELVGFTGITPHCSYNVGTTPGYLLWNLLEVDSDLAPLALANLVHMASPAAEWAEVYGPGGNPHGGYSMESPNRLRPWESGIALDAIYRYYRKRRPYDEPRRDQRGSVVDGKTRGPGATRTFTPSPPSVPKRVVVVTADRRDVELAVQHSDAKMKGVTLVEAGLPMAADYFERLLFDSATGERRVDVLILGSSALSSDLCSMKPPSFWWLPEVVGAFRRFESTGGQLIKLSSG